MPANILKISDNYNVVYGASGYKPLCFIQGKLLTYKSGKVFTIELENFRKENICNLRIDNKIKFLSKSRLLTRLLRLEPRGVIKIDDSIILFCFKGNIYCLNIKTKDLKDIQRFRKNMSAPLYLTAIKNVKNFTVKYCYGEYFSNPEKREVSIYGSYGNVLEWQEIFRFPRGEINHIHSIVPDPYQNKVWIFTGDFGNAACIWYTDDNFKTVRKYLSGKQQYRACVGYPTDKGLIYITDTPLEENNIYLISKDGNVEKLCEIEGSCIYGASFNGKLIFSTVVEGHVDEKQNKSSLFSYRRGKGIKSWHSKLMIGNIDEGFRAIGMFEKDIFPMGLMQFGTVTFPSEKNESGKIIIYGNSLKRIDGKLLILEEIKNR